MVFSMQAFCLRTVLIAWQIEDGKTTVVSLVPFDVIQILLSFYTKVL